MHSYDRWNQQTLPVGCSYLSRRFEAIARFIIQARRVDIMALALRTQPICDSTMVTGSDGRCRARSSLSLLRVPATANDVLTVGLRVCLQFFLQQVIHFTSEAKMPCNWSRSFSSSLCSPESSSLPVWQDDAVSVRGSLRLGFRKAKPRHQRRFRFIFIRMISITSSILRNATSKPSRIAGA